MRKLLVTSAAAILAGGLAVTAASPASARGSFPTIVSPVTAEATCTGTSHQTITLQASARHNNEIVVLTQDERAGYWTTTVTRDSDNGLIIGFGTGRPEITGGVFYRSSTSLSGPLDRGTSGVTVVAERTNGLPGPGVPVLETCTAHLTVTAR